MISIIAALTKERVIGKDNKLIWHISEDLKRFKQLTTNNTIIMGRKTFESIGKPLPNRNNIVVSRSVKEISGVFVCDNLDSALEKAKEFGKEIFIIGGAQIYGQSLEFANRMFLSYVKKEYEGDAYFPEFGSEWKEVKRENFEEFEFVEYEREI